MRYVRIRPAKEDQDKVTVRYAVYADQTPGPGLDFLLALIKIR
jgi:hypothetical protein